METEKKRRLIILICVLIPVVIIAGIMGTRYVTGRIAERRRAAEMEPQERDGQSAGGQNAAGRETAAPDGETAAGISLAGPESLEGSAVEAGTLSEDTDLSDDVPFEIRQIFEGYFQAKLAGEAGLASSYFEGPAQDLEEEARRLSWELKYIEDYRDILCYAAPGPEADSYVVYVYYKIKFFGSEVMASSLSSAYVRKGADGICRIQEEVSPEIRQYMELVGGLESVGTLVRQVKEEWDAAVLEDAGLAELYREAMAGQEENMGTGESES